MAFFFGQTVSGASRENPFLRAAPENGECFAEAKSFGGKIYQKRAAQFTKDYERTENKRSASGN